VRTERTAGCDRRSTLLLLALLAAKLGGVDARKLAAQQRSNTLKTGKNFTRRSMCWVQRLMFFALF
jgi:hypothetical protein